MCVSIIVWWGEKGEFEELLLSFTDIPISNGLVTCSAAGCVPGCVRGVS